MKNTIENVVKGSTMEVGNIEMRKTVNLSRFKEFLNNMNTSKEFQTSILDMMVNISDVNGKEIEYVLYGTGCNGKSELMSIIHKAFNLELKYYANDSCLASKLSKSVIYDTNTIDEFNMYKLDDSIKIIEFENKIHIDDRVKNIANTFSKKELTDLHDFIFSIVK